MKEQSEKQLVQACQRGDKAAYAWLAKKYSKQVFAVCLGILGNVHDAEDMAQDALIKGLTRLNKLRDSDQFSRWIFRIARNLCIDYIRRKKIGKEALKKVNQPEYSEPEDNSDLKLAIEKLPEKYRIPLMLYYFEGHNTEAVASFLEISPAGVCSRLSRARTKLRYILNQQRGIDEKTL